jgi:uncharacterized protein (TIGR02266 family)
MCRLTYNNEVEFIEKYASNISKTGIFIGTLKPKPVGEILRFELQLGDGTALFKGKGEVMWKRTASPSGAPPGMGIKYVQLSEQGKALIKKVMAFKASHGDKFDKPSRYSMMPPPEDRSGNPDDDGDGTEMKISSRRREKRKMKKLDLDEIDAMLDEIASSAVSTKKRVRHRRREGARSSDVPGPRPSSAPAAREGEGTTDTVPPPLPSSPPPAPASAEAPPGSFAPAEEPSPVASDTRVEAPGVLVDEEEFDAPDLPSEIPPPPPPTSEAPPAADHPRFSSGPAVEAVYDSLTPDVQIEQLTDEEMSEVSEVEDLGADMAAEADLLEPDVDSGTAPPKEVMEMSEEELAGVLEDVYSKEDPDTSGDMIHDEELDALLNALEETDDAEEIDEIEEIDVVEIEDEI